MQSVSSKPGPEAKPGRGRNVADRRLAATFSIAAAVWVGSIARETVLEQHIRRLSLETDQLSSDLGQALVARLDAIRASERILRVANDSGRDSALKEVFDELSSVYPQLDWIAVANADGVLLRASGALPGASAGTGDVRSSHWFAGGLHGPWLGVIDQSLGRDPGPGHGQNRR